MNMFFFRVDPKDKLNKDLLLSFFSNNFQVEKK